MRIIAKCFVLVACAVMVAGVAYAGDSGDGNAPQRQMEMDRGMMRPPHGMMPKTMVASSDGGVIVMAGNKLQKYDKDLKLKKEVEITSDMPEGMYGMMGMMSGMKKQCPIMGSSEAEGKGASKE